MMFVSMKHCNYGHEVQILVLSGPTTFIIVLVQSFAGCLYGVVLYYSSD